MLTRLPSSLRERMTGLSSKSWFPQVPISLAMALLGLLHLIPVFEQALELLQHMRTPASVRGDLTGIDLLGISQLSIGVFLLAMSVGLWFRSQIAWLLSILATVIGLINLYFEPDTPIPAWLFGYDFVLIAVMLTSRRHFDLSSMRLGTLIALSALVVLVGYSIVGIYHFGDQFSPEINTFPKLSICRLSPCRQSDTVISSRPHRGHVFSWHPSSSSALPCFRPLWAPR